MIINLLLTGNELMAGDTIDSNSAMIARELLPLGWTIRKKLTVGDDLELLIASLRELTRNCDVLLVNGGLGPTVDDLTAQALAVACGVPLAEHPAALAHVEACCRHYGIALNAANRKQALLPAGADIIANAAGTAVGFAMPLDGCRVLCTPGVPRELETMLAVEIIPALRRQFSAGATVVRRTALFGIGESSLQQRISEAVPAWPTEVELGFRAGFPLLELKLTSHDEAGHQRAQALLQQLQPLLADYRVGEGDASLARQVVNLLAARGHKLALAESCTGGLIAAQLTQIPGASQVFDAGLVTYSNAIKRDLLGVDAAALERDGAVSETVVLQMAAGALRLSGADYAIAVSGIAGPDGGTPDKPVGTVWVAWGGRDALQAQRLQVRWPRLQFQQYVAAVGLDLLRRRLEGITARPSYFPRP
jgi:nicotinamide-nucleotide amidase